MRIARIKIEGFRGIAKGELLLPNHVALVGDNNSGKSTILEAIDLVLGPERLAKRPPVDEHDFYAGRYLNLETNSVEIKVEVVVVDLSDEQARHFVDHLEWWDKNTNKLLDSPPPEGTDGAEVIRALRLGFTGTYDKDEDDFSGSTYFLSPVLDDGKFTPFKTQDKRMCGFLFLRTLRTGSRALTLERGSLLDIILRLQDKRLQMWEEVLQELRKLPVADKPEIGITAILSNVQNAVRSFVPSEWIENPHMRVSDLTRETLRRALTVFMGTGAKREDGSDYAAPFQHQGTGTINILVLSLLSIIAELKQNVIFAMEEPEIAIPPHTQKRIVESIRKKSAQSLFTSHSPYVLEEFDPAQILVLRRDAGILSGAPATYPPTIKPKKYRTEFRLRFCEALLANRVFITEGNTEYDAFPVAARRLHEIKPDQFKTLEMLGVAVINAQTDSQIAPLGEHFSKLGKVVFAACDLQEGAQKQAIQTAIPYLYESTEKGFENVLLKGTAEAALRRYALGLVNDQEWPIHLTGKKPTKSMSVDTLRDALSDYLSWAKASGGAAGLLAQCSVEEMPKFITETLSAIQTTIESRPSSLETGEEPAVSIVR